MIFSILFSLLSLGFSGSTQATPAAPPHLYISKDKGESWQSFTKGLPEGTTPSNILHHQGGTYLTTDAHGVYFLPNDENTWQHRSKSLPQRIDVNSIAADGDKLAIGTFRQGVFLSFDGGQRWTPSIFNLRAGSVLALLFHEGALIAGTDSGIFRSLDGGMSWQLCSDRLQTSDLVSFKGRLYAARLKGIYVSDDDGTSWQKNHDQNYAQRFITEGETLYALLHRNEIIRTEDGGKNWDIPVGMLNSSNAATLPQKLWLGYEPELPDNNLWLRFIFETPMGWLAGAMPEGC